MPQPLLALAQNPRAHAADAPSTILFESVPSSISGIIWRHVNGRSADYYLPETTWRQWSSTQDSSLPSFQQAIARHYYSLVILNFNQTPAADDAISFDLSKDGGYALTAKVRSGKTVFYVWEHIGRV